MLYIFRHTPAQVLSAAEPPPPGQVQLLGVDAGNGWSQKWPAGSDDRVGGRYKSRRIKEFGGSLTDLFVTPLKGVNAAKSVGNSASTFGSGFQRSRDVSVPLDRCHRLWVPQQRRECCLPCVRRAKRAWYLTLRGCCSERIPAIKPQPGDRPSGIAETEQQPTGAYDRVYSHVQAERHRTSRQTDVLN